MTINRQFILLIACFGGIIAAAQSLTTFPADAAADAKSNQSQLANVDATRSEVAVAAPKVPFKLNPLDTHSRTSLTVVEQLRHAHYLPKELNDTSSSATFDKYIDSLDGAKSYLLASDIAEFEKHRYSLDDALKRGKLKPAFDIFNRYQNRVVDRLEWVIAYLSKGITDIDFDIDERLEVDRENAPWANSPSEIDDLWRRRIKASVLSMKLNGKEIDEIQTLLSKRYKNRLKQAKQIREEDAFQLYMNAYASTYDPHTSYLSPRSSETFNINMSLSLEGIGAVLRTEDDYTEVVSLVTGGPADKSGKIKPDDRIISVAQGERGAMIDVVGWRLDDVVALIRGHKGSIVRLEISSGDEAITKEVRMTREAVQLEDQSAQKKVLTIDRGGVPHKIGIIEVPTFYVDIAAERRREPNFKSTTRDVRNLINELKTEGVESLIIDLRNNGGGSLREADLLTGLFIKSGPTVQVKTARRRANIYADEDDQIAWDGPMAVLVNRLSASASEIFAGAIQDYGRGLIIGSQTFGKGTVQTLIPLNRGQLKITQAKFYRISGQSTQHQGVIPDVEFPELYDNERIGESSLDDALPWDVIQPAIYDSFGDFSPLLDDLTRQHVSRTATDPQFDYLRALTGRNEQNRKKTHISLREKTRIAEKADDDAWRLGVENKLRLAKGKEALKTLEELEDLEEETADDETAPEDDAMVNETGHILIDYIQLQQQVAAVELNKDTAVR